MYVNKAEMLRVYGQCGNVTCTWTIRKCYVYTNNAEMLRIHQQCESPGGAGSSNDCFVRRKGMQQDISGERKFIKSRVNITFGVRGTYAPVLCSKRFGKAPKINAKRRKIDCFFNQRNNKYAF